MRKFLKRDNLFDILFIFCLSLVPLLWYKNPNSFAIGHDLFFPLDPLVLFRDRMFLWSGQLPLGFNYSQFRGFEDFGDIFDMFFSGFTGSSRNNRSRKGHDLRYDLTIDFEEAVKGSEREIEIELMVKEMLKDERTNLVGGRFIPVEQDTLMGKFSVISFLIIEDAFLKLNKGNNYYALVGGASLMRKSLYKSFKYPKGTISYQNYLFLIKFEQTLQM